MKFSCLLRALGNSSVPLIFLAVSAVLNIGPDILFVAVFPLEQEFFWHTYFPVLSGRLESGWQFPLDGDWQIWLDCYI